MASAGFERTGTKEPLYSTPSARLDEPSLVERTSRRPSLGAVTGTRRTSRRSLDTTARGVCASRDAPSGMVQLSSRRFMCLHPYRQAH